MRIEDLDYELPEDRIAQEPLPVRDASRLLAVDAVTREIEDRSFTELASLLPPSLFVFNDTRVIPARLTGRKSTGGKVELLLLQKQAGGSNRWSAMGRASKRLRVGMELVLCEASLHARVVRVLDDGLVEVDFQAEGDVDALLERVGDVPLPPYIRRPPGASDRERYQTVYARSPGAVAAPTAGLHFTEKALGGLREAGHGVAHVTLHVGPGTFRPVQAHHLEDHEMHEEAYEVPPDTVAAIEAARAEGRSIAAVGTTVVRTLEASVGVDGRPRVGAGRTRLFIRPPYRFRVVDHLLTNFHLPRSTLLALVMAFADVELIREAYRHAIDHGYRFYSYGDAMLIRRGSP